nr:S8 family serine peptidase [Nocardioides ungokensis]
MSGVNRHLRRALVAAGSAAALVASTAALIGTSAPAQATATGPTQLYLVTLDGPGTSGYHGILPTPLNRVEMRQEQDAVLARVGEPEPVYRWTTALNGFAVRLTRAQADEVALAPHVTLVEKNAVRHLAGAPAHTAGLAGSGHQKGGAGTVVGVVDSGIWPDSPLFADVPHLGRAPRSFHGECQGGDDWDAATCNRKLVGARWFVDGFGADRVRTSSSLSARDDDGHGSEMASIAAGNAGVSVLVTTSASAGTAASRPRPPGRLQGLLDRTRPGRRRLRDRRPGHGHRPGDRDGSTCSTYRWADRPPSTPWSAPCSARPRPTSWWSRPPATTAPARTPRTPAPG